MPILMIGLINLLNPIMSTKRDNNSVPSNVVAPYDAYNLTNVKAVLVLLVSSAKLG